MDYLPLKRNWCLRILRHSTNEVKWARSPTARVHMSPLTQATSGSLSSALNFCSVRFNQTKRTSRHSPLLTLLTNPQPIDYFSYCWALLAKAVNWSLRQTLRWTMYDSHSLRAFRVSGGNTGVHILTCHHLDQNSISLHTRVHVSAWRQGRLRVLGWQFYLWAVSQQ